MQAAAFEIGSGAGRGASAFTGSNLHPLQRDAVFVGYLVFASLALLEACILMKRFDRV